MRKSLSLLLACLVAVAGFAAGSSANEACITGNESGTAVAATVGQGLGATTILVRLLPGGTAEYIAGGTCTPLTFTAIRDGSAIYTDDGLGCGLTVAVAPNRTLTVSHTSGWVARSQ